jgi:hypothetical protein
MALIPMLQLLFPWLPDDVIARNVAQRAHLSIIIIIIIIIIIVIIIIIFLFNGYRALYPGAKAVEGWR